MSAYFVIEKGTANILGGFWTRDYTLAEKKAAQLGGVVTSESWLRRRLRHDPRSGLERIDSSSVFERQSAGVLPSRLHPISAE